MTAKVQFLLRRIGLHATCAGFHYLAYAVILVLNDETYLLNLTKRLYPEIASAFHTAPSCVERSLRTILDILWYRGDVRLLEELIGYSIPHKPYTGELIDILAGYFRSMK